MGGRGRGRGQAVSFNIESLGFGRGDAMPVSVTQPPPIFPPLENRPLPLHRASEDFGRYSDEGYILVTRKDLNTRLRNSPYYLGNGQSDSEPNSYLDRDLPVLWDRMPAELKKTISSKRSLITKGNSKARKGRRIDDPNNILAKLEEKEKVEGDGEDVDEQHEDEEKEQSDEEKVEFDEDGENEIDEEMDEGTDYAREYFDNGENYLDEDDGDDGEAIF